MNAFGGTNDPGNPPGSSSSANHTRVFANSDLTTLGQSRCQVQGNAWAGTNSVSFCTGVSSRQDYDVVSHEFSHLVARNMSFNADGTRNSLINENLSGALNESFSDIMGEAFEKFQTGNNDWLFWKRETGSIALRILSNPGAKTDSWTVFNVPFPSNFNSDNFYCGTEGSGGIHHNSTVPSHAAYLASEGGSLNGCSFEGIGFDKVMQIWYRALTTYFTPNETFNMAYNSLRNACFDLYGSGSTDCEILTYALQATQMNQPGKCSGLAASPPACASNQCLLAESFAEI
jgi:Zn-dependent metalloprotease